MAANKNSLTAKLYAEIKPQLKTPKDDEKVMKKYNYSKSTVQKIRNTKNWHDYEARTHRFDGYPRKNQPAKPSAPRNHNETIAPDMEAEIQLAVMKERNEKLAGDILRLTGELQRSEENYAVLERKYRSVKDDYDELEDYFKHRTRAVAFVFFGLGAILGACFGVVLVLIIKGAL